MYDEYPFEIEQLLVPTMCLSGHQWHSSGGCLAGIVHRTWTRRLVGDRVVPSKGRGIASHDGMIISIVMIDFVVPGG